MLHEMRLDTFRRLALRRPVAVGHLEQLEESLPDKATAAEWAVNPTLRLQMHLVAATIAQAQQLQRIADAMGRLTMGDITGDEWLRVFSGVAQ